MCKHFVNDEEMTSINFTEDGRYTFLGIIISKARPSMMTHFPRANKLSSDNIKTYLDFLT